MPNGFYWIDTNSGTWGTVDGLRFVELSESQVEKMDGMSDSAICTIAELGDSLKELLLKASEDG